jgi:tetraacyldisaccharide 4'-kinase
MRWILAKIYGCVIRIRLFLYEREIFKSSTLRDPVISVGNLTVGGTGKTPFVAFLANILKKAGHQPVILTRGYRGSARVTPLLVNDETSILCKPEECGDEPYLLARKLPGVPIVVGKNRVESGQFIEKKFSPVIHILDDGFQHLQLDRDLNIALLDGTDPFGGNALLPAGRLREPVSALKRADMILITRSHLLTNPDEVELAIRRINPLAPISYFYHDAIGLLDFTSDKRVPLSLYYNQRVVAMAAIGNPSVFLEDLAHYQFKIVDEFLFRDHHPYSQKDLDRVLESLESADARAVITTEKDAVRLQDLDFPPGRILALQIEPRPEDIDDYTAFILKEIESLSAR